MPQKWNLSSSVKCIFRKTRAYRIVVKHGIVFIVNFDAQCNLKLRIVVIEPNKRKVETSQEYSTYNWLNSVMWIKGILVNLWLEFTFGVLRNINHWKQKQTIHPIVFLVNRNTSHCNCSRELIWLFYTIHFDWFTLIWPLYIIRCVNSQG